MRDGPPVTSERLEAARVEVWDNRESYRQHLIMAAGYVLAGGLCGCHAAIERAYNEAFPEGPPFPKVT